MAVVAVQCAMQNQAGRTTVRYNDEPVLTNSASQQSMLEDLLQVTGAGKDVLGKTVQSRLDTDRKEIRRILGHLPMVKEARFSRSLKKTSDMRPRSAELWTAPRGAVYTPRAATGAQATLGDTTAVTAVLEAAAEVRHTNLEAWQSTPRQPVTGQGSRTLHNVAHASHSAGVNREPATSPAQSAQFHSTGAAAHTAAGVADHHASTVTIGSNLLSARQVPAATSPLGIKQAQAARPPSRTDGTAIRRPQTPGRAEKIEVQLQAETQLRSSEAEALAARAQAKLQEEMKQTNLRQLEKLAEVGIDPKDIHNMTASDILNMLYARGSGSSYWQMTREVQTTVLIRPVTPNCLGTVLTPRAQSEVKRARDLPVHLVHDYLDKWEVDTLADVCRSIRHFDENGHGAISEYTRTFGQRQYGMPFNRKKWVRPPTR